MAVYARPTIPYKVSTMTMVMRMVTIVGVGRVVVVCLSYHGGVGRADYVD